MYTDTSHQGLTVASRLAQRKPDLRILVIEAGSDQRGNAVVEDPAKCEVTISFLLIPNQLVSSAGSAFLSPGLAKLFFSAPQHDTGRQLFMLWSVCQLNQLKLDLTVS
jgi:hypothetical protein